ncbi:host attachment protein [Altererythrobacter aquiaggeris]|uniref:baeRF12 domain-containing protein n=1 Tax=Aestuarierythrobacter aquiaggeris TaxID=1898396 RepID=UPI00301B51CE
MKLPHKAHVAVVDGKRFILLHNTGQPFEPKLDGAETPDLEATNFSAGVKHQDDGGQKTGATDLDELAHAAAAAEWLNRAVMDGKIKQLMVVADPKTLGEMRRHYNAKLKEALVGELAKTLTGENSSVIAKAIASA